MYWTANRMFIRNQREVHSNVCADLVLVPMPRIHLDEKPLSIRAVTLELHFGNSGITRGFKQTLRDRNDFRNVYRFDSAASAEKWRILPKLSCGEVSRQFMFCIHEAATHRDIRIVAIHVFLNHDFRT